MILSVCTVLFLMTPQDYDFAALASQTMTTEAQYKETEPAFIAAVAVLEKQPLGELTQAMPASKFAMAWLTKSPTVKINMDADYLHLAGENPGMLMMSMLGAARSAILNPSSAALDHKIAGFETALKMYDGDETAKPDPVVDKILQAWKAGNLVEAMGHSH